MTTIQIIYIACTAGIYLITHLVYLITAFIKASKDKKLDLLKSTILGFMEEAEKFVHYSAEEKKNYVITRIKEFINNSHVKISDNQINSLIERFIDFSNNVNIKKKGNK